MPDDQLLSPVEFAQAIKAKYPDYASVPDEELAARMLEKYPEYRSRVRETPTFTATNEKDAEGDAVTRFGSAFLETINPINQVKALYQQVRHPIESANARLQYQAEHPGLAALAQSPLGQFGGVQAGARIGSGDVAGGLGEGLGDVVNVTAPELVGRAAAGVKRFVNTPRFVNANPTEAAAIAESRAAGIPVPAGAATGNRFVQAVQAAADQTPIGAAVEVKARQAEAAALRRRGEQLAGDAHPAPATAESAGREVLAGVRQTVSGLDRQADEAYTALRQIEALPEHAQTIQTAAEGSPRYQQIFGKLSKGWTADGSPVDAGTAEGKPVGVRPTRAELVGMRQIEAELEAQPYQRGRLVRESLDTSESRYVRGSANADVYHDLHGAMGYSDTTGQGPSGAEMRGDIRHTLETGEWNAASKAAFRVAQERLRSSGRLTGPSLPQGAPILGTTETVQLPVDLRGVKRELRPIYDRLKREAELVPLQGDKARALTALDRLMQGRDYESLSVVDAALGDLKAMARGAAMPELRSVGQGLAAGSVARLDAAVRATAAQAGRAATEALETGRGATVAKYAVGEILDAIESAGPEAEPVKAYKTLTAAKDTNLALLRRVQEAAPAQIPVVGRAVLEGLLDKATAEGGFIRASGLLEDWNRLGPETKKLLYGPELTQKIDRFLLTAKRLGESPNPSRTALAGTSVGSALWIFTNPATGIPVTLGAGALSKILRSPKAVDFLLSGLQLKARPGLVSKAAQTAAWTNLVQALRASGQSVPQAADQGSSTNPPEPSR